MRWPYEHVPESHNKGIQSKSYMHADLLAAKANCVFERECSVLLLVSLAGQQVVPQNSWCACSAPLGQRRLVLLTGLRQAALDTLAPGIAHAPL